MDASDIVSMELKTATGIMVSLFLFRFSSPRSLLMPHSLAKGTLTKAASRHKEGEEEEESLVAKSGADAPDWHHIIVSFKFEAIAMDLQLY